MECGVSVHMGTDYFVAATTTIAICGWPLARTPYTSLRRQLGTQPAP